MSLIDKLKASPIAVNTADANTQHYEVPTQFYQYCLGKNLKYSSGYWKPGVTDIDTSEDDMLALTCERAELNRRYGYFRTRLRLGFFIALFMAAKYPKAAPLTVVSNSRTQKMHIDEQAKQRGITNLTVITVRYQ